MRRVVLLCLLLQSYERDGWGEFPTQISPDRREIRPTADRWAGRQAGAAELWQLTWSCVTACWHLALSGVAAFTCIAAAASA